MNDTLLLVVFLAGLAMFVVGDILWLVRNTFNRPMNLRLTGGLVIGGVVLLSFGLLGFALQAGN